MHGWWNDRHHTFPMLHKDVSFNVYSSRLARLVYWSLQTTNISIFTLRFTVIVHAGQIGMRCVGMLTLVSTGDWREFMCSNGVLVCASSPSSEPHSSWHRLCSSQSHSATCMPMQPCPVVYSRGRLLVQVIRYWETGLKFPRIFLVIPLILQVGIKANHSNFTA